MTAEWGPSLDAGYPAEMHYRIDAETADFWREVRKRTTVT
jgi:hypothetical protein